MKGWKTESRRLTGCAIIVVGLILVYDLLAQPRPVLGQNPPLRFLLGGADDEEEIADLKSAVKNLPAT